MIEIKQLKFFVVCAEMRSFSRAAEVLYTTQPNVSKVIHSLEEELGFELFTRKSRGADMTVKGRRVYDHACKVIDNIHLIHTFARMDKGNELLISTNPSSWMTAAFCEFYNSYKDQDVCFHIMTASTEDIIRRLSDGKDDIGFVYIPEPQMADFLYRLEKNSLEFMFLKKMDPMLYLGAKHPDAGAASMDEIQADSIRLVQCYEDEFSMFWNRELLPQEQDFAADMKVSVITNSDYVMNGMLANTDLANISSAYLSHEGKTLGRHGIALYEGKQMVHFGAIVRKEENLGEWPENFLNFVKKRL